ncbi:MULTISPECIES: hypothetical protein [Streptomyces]|uniref:Uncharacterized protein n=2 Tax=Streptomyces bottropensis TaxID=42235 RepID=M3F8K5_9ACTN|nr:MULTISPECIES: hypothetical protein [Streptomyces]EMF57988.1 hypothetical protein SBD_0660 [Streptomyces bottropensis ATCC 25435]MZD18487.1 hypothetical protein [Streptomyces sp. SID5476]WSG27620.1 hypothetical protein OHB30_45545 [Streptomyces europaeiscabiei]
MTALTRLRTRNPFAGEAGPWRIAGAALLLLTLAGQHPHRDFSRVRVRDYFSMLPNWRFFAPHPAMFDYHFLYRTVDADGTASNWQDVSGIVDRKPMHLVWFPTRRSDKCVFDACQEILSVIEQGFKATARTPGYRLITEHVRVRIASQGESAGAVRGFQFALASATGYDERRAPQLMFVSPYVPLDPHAPSTPLTPARTEEKARVGS